jgi:hypothetical protein
MKFGGSRWLTPMPYCVVGRQGRAGELTCGGDQRREAVTIGPGIDRVGRAAARRTCPQRRRELSRRHFWRRAAVAGDAANDVLVEIAASSMTARAAQATAILRAASPSAHDALSHGRVDQQPHHGGGSNRMASRWSTPAAPS